MHELHSPRGTREAVLGAELACARAELDGLKSASPARPASPRGFSQRSSMSPSKSTVNEEDSQLTAYQRYLKYGSQTNNLSSPSFHSPGGRVVVPAYKTVVDGGTDKMQIPQEISPTDTRYNVWKSPGHSQEKSWAFTAPDKISFYETDSAPHVKVRMETRLTAVEQSQLHDLFDLIDCDGNEFLDIQEVDRDSNTNPNSKPQPQTQTQTDPEPDSRLKLSMVVTLTASSPGWITTMTIISLESNGSNFSDP